MTTPRSDTSTLTVVMCGSMAQRHRMLELRDALWPTGMRVVVPVDESDAHDRYADPSQFAKFKRRVSERYFRIIRRRDVWAVLIVNSSKGRRPDYIGPNTLAEIAIAVNARKRVYLLEGVYKPFADELVAWSAIPLHADLSRLIQDYRDAAEARHAQLHLHLSETTGAPKT